MTEQSRTDLIRQGIEENLKKYELAGRVTFDDSAISKIEDLFSSNDVRGAVEYTGLLVLDALEQSRTSVSEGNLTAELLGEYLALIKGEKNPWQQVGYSQKNRLVPLGIRTRRILELMDAKRMATINNEIANGALPPHASLKGIKYQHEGDDEEEVKIPFLGKFRISEYEVKAVATSLAIFLSGDNAVEDASYGESIQYFVRPRRTGNIADDAKGPNYRILNLRGLNEVAIIREPSCRIPSGRLEDYVKGLTSDLLNPIK
ncbi:hypothetical protein HYT23_01100 [Candidatus Pacearchaeota archaeon]|nr:hypothetical protein [Candidatus Pacearchaeota archaeon]